MNKIQKEAIEELRELLREHGIDESQYTDEQVVNFLCDSIKIVADAIAIPLKLVSDTFLKLAEILRDIKPTK